MKVLKAAFINLLQAVFGLLFMGSILVFALSQQTFFIWVGLFFLVLMVIMREVYKQVSWPGKP